MCVCLSDDRRGTRRGADGGRCGTRRGDDGDRRGTKRGSDGKNYSLGFSVALRKKLRCIPAHLPP